MVGMLIEVPEELRGFGMVMANVVADLRETLHRTGGGKALDYGEVEQLMAEAAATVEREGHRPILQALDVDSPTVEIGGKQYSRVGRFQATYYTMAGPVEIERALYRECGVRNGKTVDPVSLRVGAVGAGWLPSTAQAMAHDLERCSSRGAEASARVHMRLTYRLTSFQEVGHKVGALYAAAHADVEDALVETYEVPLEAES